MSGGKPSRGGARRRHSFRLFGRTVELRYEATSDPDALDHELEELERRQGARVWRWEWASKQEPEPADGAAAAAKEAPGQTTILGFDRRDVVSTLAATLLVVGAALDITRGDRVVTLPLTLCLLAFLVASSFKSRRR